MIIHFDLDSSKVILLQQQNDKKSFVVDFLFKKTENQNEINFSDTIQKICEDRDILKILKKEKNTVVLPNDIVCVDNITVPYQKRDTREYMLSKFDLQYGGREKFVIYDEIYAKNKNTATFLVYIVKTLNITQILFTFEKYGVKIKKISFESSVMLESVLTENRQFSKENLIVVKVKNNGFDFIVSTKGKIFAHDQFDLNSNQFAKKLAKYIKTNYKKLSKQSSINQKEIEKIKVNLPKNEKKLAFLPVFIKDLQEFYKKSDFEFNFDDVIIVDENNQIKNVDFGKKLELDKSKNVICTGKNYFIEQKKGLF